LFPRPRVRGACLLARSGTNTRKRRSAETLSARRMLFEAAARSFLDGNALSQLMKILSSMRKLLTNLAGKDTITLMLSKSSRMF
jgi:hypothetical protein